MKKIIFILAIAASFTSCSVVRHSTAATQDVNTSITSRNAVELDVAEQKISYTYRPTRQDRKAGIKHVVNNAVAAALRENGDADVLVQKQQEVVYRVNMFGARKIKTVTVTGYPAVYKNFSIKK